MQRLPAMMKMGLAAGPRFLLAMTCCALAALSACTGGPSTPPPSRNFSGTAYFEGEARRLEKEHTQLRKTVRRNGSSDSAVIAAPDWSRELEPFVQCDIGKPSLASAYRADTLQLKDTLALRYTSVEPSAPVKQVTVLSAGDRVVRLLIETGDTNALFRMRRHLDYRPGEGYDIEGVQAMKMGETTRYTIHGRWK